MDTGIVAGTAPVVAIEVKEGARKLTIDLGGYLEGLEVGASVAIDGVCMTVVSIDGKEVVFDAIDETLERTTLGQVEEGAVVNVERSLKVGDELGGHILSGHVMTMGKITDRHARGEGLYILVENPESVRPVSYTHLTLPTKA